LGGCFGDWSSGLSETWQAKWEKPFSPSERAASTRRVEEARKHAAAERQQQYADAAAKAASIWEEAEPANDGHPYLVRKGIEANGARLHRSALVIPVRSGSELHPLQFIAEDGRKQFLSGGRMSGVYFSIGTIQGADALCIAEEFATGATVHQATGYPVAVAFHAGNLESVVIAVRRKLPNLPLTICADDDADTEGNPGITKALIPLVASSALAALSLAAQAHADAKRAEKLQGPTGLFLLTIANSGERKSTCDGFFMQAIRDYETKQADKAKPKIKDHEAAMDA